MYTYWPEDGYAADFFTCGNNVNPWKSFDYLKKELGCETYNCMELKEEIMI